MLSIKVVDVVPLRDMNLLVFFEDESIRKFDVKKLFANNPEFKILENEDLFNNVSVEPGGYGISWNDELDCSEGELYEQGEKINLSQNDFYSFVKHNLINTKEAAEILGCSKQNIDDLVKRKKIFPIKSGLKYNLYLKSEIKKRLW